MLLELETSRSEILTDCEDPTSQSIWAVVDADSPVEVQRGIAAITCVILGTQVYTHHYSAASMPYDTHEWSC